MNFGKTSSWKGFAKFAENPPPKFSTGADSFRFFSALFPSQGVLKKFGSFEHWKKEQVTLEEEGGKPQRGTSYHSPI
jgi:hypothetical protein